MVRVPCMSGRKNATEEQIDQCERYHIGVSSVEGRRDSVRKGCYVLSPGGRECAVRLRAPAGYAAWLEDLCQFALGVTIEEIYDRPRRFRGKPFVELLTFPASNDGHAIGPVTSAKLHGDFVAFAAKAKKHYFQAQSHLTKAAPSKRRGQVATNLRLLQYLQGNIETVAASLGGKINDEPLDGEAMCETYRDLRKCFKLASDGGFVHFS
jgi:hypothetical protein